MLNYDVAVIGAGPAGAWAARQLAAGGMRVLLADPSHPREKPCGGGVTDRALAIVDGAIQSMPAVRIHEARFLDARRSISIPLTPAGGLIVASRSAFDGLLLDAAITAGASHVAARVTGLLGEPGGFVVALAGGARWRVPFVIGADGASGICRRALAARFERHHLSVATGFFAHGVTDDAIAIEFVDDPPGYIWSFPRPDHLAIGICAQADACTGSGALRERAAAWIRARGMAEGRTLQPYAWPIPSLTGDDIEHLCVSGPRWMLIGDAAGLVDPITREGIFFALQSAQYAADALLSGAAQPEAIYASRVRGSIGGELTRAARLKAAFFKPRFTRLLLDALAESEAIGQVMADLVAGAQGYRGLRRRLLGTGEITLAARLLLGR